VLVDEGLFLLQTVGDNFSRTSCDSWLDKYIFPNGVAPSVRQIGQGIEGIFVVEDWHNFGPDYYPTLMAWYENLRKNYSSLALEVPMPRDRFYRMWEYFYTSFASAFKTRRLQLWQIVMSKGTIPAVASIR
jgi:cyclopropane-fatty-acyl-phospholipid synthase